ncbi:DNA gyrase inhibitor YacG [Thioalkalivibrio sp. XN279]|uniref:DNA gyrase inhibitor YacG n=1 Tax=Thioalkalivibrio sp. XN279 TaxID=2714953 RepID=UPI00140A4E37|nr:DNA gyrase inhibitor YacG [Thioalkalivibrio sp. XN279]NHA16045.1 DNA gyrase inhibitor YacG [Thioalkalivibrio sp. XN279]
MREVECPHCGKPVPWTPESRWRPFCSERCRLIDLGQWFGEEHAIPGEPGDGHDLPDDDLDDEAR